MNKKTLNKIKELLILEKNQTLKSNQPKTIDIDTDGDETDEIQANLILALSKELTLRNKIKLIQIDNALNKIQNGNFGICEDCEDEILEKRLLINPYFSTCVSCAEDREKQDKIKKV